MADYYISHDLAISELMPIYKSASLKNRNVLSVARKCLEAIENLPAADVVERSTHNYMLISVCDREILTERFSSLEDAQHQMHTEMVEWGKVPEEIFRENAEEYEDTECGFGEHCAWANDGFNHADYDWLIVSL